MKPTTTTTTTTTTIIDICLALLLYSCIKARTLWIPLSKDYTFQSPWDDQENFVNNEALIQSCGKGLNWKWIDLHGGESLSVFEPAGLIIKSYIHCYYGLRPQLLANITSTLQGINTVLIYFLAQRISKLNCKNNTSDFLIYNSLHCKLLTFAICAMNSLHPIHSEVLCWMSCITYVFALFFILIGLHTYIYIIQSSFSFFQTAPTFLQSLKFVFCSIFIVMTFSASFFSKTATIMVPVYIFWLHLSGILVFPSNVYFQLIATFTLSISFIVTLVALMFAYISTHYSSPGLTYEILNDQRIVTKLARSVYCLATQLYHIFVPTK